MKNKLFLFLFLLFLTNIPAQKSYSKYLEAANLAAQKSNSDKFNENINLFKAAIDKEKVSTQNISKQDGEILSRALNFAIINKLDISKELSSLLLEFLNADIDIVRNKVSLAFLYQKGDIVAKDIERAITLFKEADKKGHSAAAFCLGYVYHYEKKDLNQARNWYLIAAYENHDKNAMLPLAMLYADNTVPFFDYKKSVLWIRKLLEVDPNNADAALHFGNLYESGFGVEQNYSIAKYWYEKSAANGNKLANTFLGILYFIGKGVSQNYDKAMEYYFKASQLNEPYAMHLLAHSYEKGTGVEQDISKAIYWYQKAVALNYLDSKNSLGTLYFKINRKSEAKLLFQDACNQGNKTACYNLDIVK